MYNPQIPMADSDQRQKLIYIQALEHSEAQFWDHFGRPRIILEVPQSPEVPQFPLGAPRTGPSITTWPGWAILARFAPAAQFGPRGDRPGVAARQMCTPRTLTPRCSPGTLTWGLGDSVLGLFWRCSGGCFGGVLGLF